MCSAFPFLGRGKRYKVSTGWELTGKSVQVLGCLGTWLHASTMFPVCLSVLGESASEIPINLNSDVFLAPHRCESHISDHALIVE